MYLGVPAVVIVGIMKIKWNLYSLL
jgi:hypothetical protein